MINDTTSHLKLPLPHKDNYLEDDVPRLREALFGVDAFAQNTELRVTETEQGLARKADATATDNALQALGSTLGGKLETATFSAMLGENFLQLSGGTGPFRINIQDGSGRVNLYWNTVGGTAPVFAAAGEDALRILFGTGGSSPQFFYAAGAGKNAGDPIVWQELGFEPSLAWKNAVTVAQNTANAALVAAGQGFIAGGIVPFNGGFGGSDGKRPIPRGKTVADEGWVLCDGSNGTPDLRDRFIVGAGGSYGAWTAGGSVWHGHGLTGNVGATTLSVSQMPSHGHDYTWLTGGWWGGDGQFLQGSNTRSVGYTGASQAHTHGLDASVAAANGLPPYYALSYIMKL